eukprot:1749538-Prymnesium_polylepis.1
MFAFPAAVEPPVTPLEAPCASGKDVLRWRQPQCLSKPRSLRCACDKAAQGLDILLLCEYCDRSLQRDERVDVCKPAEEEEAPRASQPPVPFFVASKPGGFTRYRVVCISGLHCACKTMCSYPGCRTIGARAPAPQWMCQKCRKNMVHVRCGQTPTGCLRNGCAPDAP